MRNPNNTTLHDNWMKFLIMLFLIAILPGWWSLLPLVMLLTLN